VTTTTSSVVSKVWGWRSFVWAGTVGSVLAWAWVWLRYGGAAAVMVLFAIAAVVFAVRGTAGVRVAVVGLVVAGFAMFMSSLLWMWMLMTTSGVSALDVITAGVLPMVFAALLLVGSITGFVYVRRTDTTATTATQTPAT